MSSWKQGGGVNNFEKSNRINTNTLAVSNFFLKEPYAGIFDICGGINVSGNSDLNNILVHGESIYVGPASFYQNFTTFGNVRSKENIETEKNAVIGNSIYFDNGNSQYVYGNSSGIGFNTHFPTAALDISTNLINGLKIVSSQNTNVNTFSQKNGKGVQIGSDLTSSYIYFFNDQTIASGNIDGNVTYNKGGIFTIDVSQNINLLAPVSISNRQTVSHVHGETAVIYDTSNGIFFGNIYNEQALTGTALSIISNDLSANTFMYISTPDKKGMGIGGGAYPNDLARGMGTLGVTDLSGQYTPAQMIVSGTDPVKYKTITGINTMKPRIDNYVLDINGPVHIDNGDIANVTGTIGFELYSISVAKNNRNHVLALGSSYDTNPQNKQRILKSIDYGSTWNTIDLTINLTNMNAVTSIFMYDLSHCFLTGYNNFLQYSYDGGYTWRKLNSSTVQLDINYTNIVINSQPRVNGNVIAYFSIDASSTLFTFEMPLYPYTNFPSYNYTYSERGYNNKGYIDKINSIDVNTQSIFLAGNTILKYNVNSTSWPATAAIPSVVHPSVSTYSYNEIKAFENSFVVAVGGNIISSSINGGTTWKDISLNTMYGGQGVDLKSVYIYDASNAIAAGSHGNVWITKDSGSTWNYMYTNLLNASGKSQIITAARNQFKNVVMTDPNTILLTNTIQSYIQGSQLGKSNIYAIFAPNFVNRSNNIVMDISGTLNISGDLKISDNGAIVSTNDTMNVFQLNVNTINIGNSLTGNTIIKNHLISEGTATFTNTVTVTGNTRHIGNTECGNLQVNQLAILNGNVNTNGNVNSFGGFYVLNKIGVNTTNPRYDVDVSGNVNISNNLFVLSDVSMNANVYIKGNSTFDALSKYNRGIWVNKSDLTVTGNIYGNIYPVGTAITFGGPNNDIYIGSDTNTNRQQNIYIGQSGGITNEINMSKIYIGGLNDYVFLRGNTTILQSVQQNVTSPTILLNNTSTGANASSGGAGIDIFDNSFAVIPGINKNIFGYIHVGNDLQSFIFKAPSYGAFNGINPMPNTQNDIQLLSPENRVRLGVNELILSNNQYIPSAGAVRSGLVVLQTNSDFVTYQGGHAYWNGSADADYAINVSNAFDISNIMLKIFDTELGSQTIGSNVAIGSSTVPYKLSVYGNANMYSSSNFYGNVFINGNTILPNIAITKTLTANGNIYLSGNIGIGTNTPALLLDVSGNSRFIGQTIHTNYDSTRFPLNYGTQFMDTLQPIVGTSYYQDIAISYDGGFQYALVYNKYTAIVIKKSVDFGKSWSQIALSIASNNSILQAVPKMIANTDIFTAESLTQGNITVAGAAPLSCQMGLYDICGSTFLTVNHYYKAFDNNDTTYWLSASQYSITANNDYGRYVNYRGSVLTPYKNASTTGYSIANDAYNPTEYIGYIPGEYIQVSLPYSFVLTQFTITNTGLSADSVKRIVVLGSTNGIDWYAISSDQYNNDEGSPASVTNGNKFPECDIGGRTFNTSNLLVYSPYNTYSYRHFRFVSTQTHFYNSGINDQTSPIGQCAIKTLLLGGTVQNSTGSYSATLSVSGTGKYVTVANQGYNNNTGNLYVSNNYGSTYTNTNVQPLQMDGSGIWQSVAVSQTGLYQYAAISSTNGNGNIWKSTDSGTSWTDTQFGRPNGFQSINISSNGQYVTAIQSGNASATRGNIWVSNNYGQTWNSVQQLYSYVPFNNGFLNQGSTDFNKIVAVSVTGQYQTALGLAPTNNKIAGNANIWYNNNYGQGPWTDTGYSAPMINGTVSILSSVSMSATGEYQVASFIGGNSSVRTAVYGNVLKSVDYGVTWNDVNFQVPSVNANGVEVYGYLPKLTTSINGQYITGITKFEALRDLSYNNNNSTAFSGNIFTSIIPTSIELNSTEYFGSQHTGNVFQVHGYQFNVPHDNFASIMMGYDVMWDSAYINSADQSGYNALCLNSVGGPVGISKINPDSRYILDISGVVNIENDNGVIYLQGTKANNTGIGKSVFNSITSGSNNTALGYNAFSATNFTQSTAIGYNAQPLKDNQIVLGTATESVYIPGTANSIHATSGALQVVGGIGIGGNISVYGYMNIVNDVSLNGNLIVYQTAQSTDKTNGAFQVYGGAGIRGNVNIGENITIIGNSTLSGNLIVYQTAQSTDKTNGALQVYGGAGIQGNVNIGENITISGNSMLSGNLKIGVATTDSRQLIIGGGSSYGYIYGASNKYPDSLHIGYNFYNNNTSNVINNSGIGTSRISTGPGTLAMYTGSVNVEPTNLGYYQNVNGNVGIGTSNPIQPLDISGTTRIFQNTQNVSALLITSTSNITNSINLYSNLGTSAFSSITTANDCGVIWGSASNSSTGDFIISPWNAAAYGIKITRAGRVGINMATPTATLHVTGTVTATGQITGLSFNASSDYRLKQNVQSISKTVDQLKPVEYDLSGGAHDMGFLAHEVQEMFPFLVNGEKDGKEMQSINYNGFIALLVKEIQCLKQENKALRERINLFEKRLDILELS
jgi:hypothetical protein